MPLLSAAMTTAGDTELTVQQGHRAPPGRAHRTGHAGAASGLDQRGTPDGSRVPDGERRPT